MSISNDESGIVPAMVAAYHHLFDVLFPWDLKRNIGRYIYMNVNYISACLAIR